MNEKPESVAISSLYKDKNAEMKAPDMKAGDTVLNANEIIQATGMDIVKGTEVIRGY